MHPHIKPATPQRPFHLVLTEIVRTLGGHRIVAQALYVAPVTVSKWMESPEASGQWIPVKHLQALLAELGQHHMDNGAVQVALTELLNDHFLQLCGRRSYPEDKLFELIDMLTGRHGRNGVFQP